MPDIFIPWDSTMFSDYYVDLRRKGLLNSFTLKYVEEHRAKLNESYASLGEFKDKFNVDEALVKDFLAYAENEGIEFDEEGWKSSEILIETQIKALIARNIWDIGAFYEIMSVIDDEFIKAVELLQDDSVFKKLKVG
jgi:carboxyl-terminal processing protease